MAVEQMKMLQIVAPLAKVDEVLLEIFRSGKMQLVDALSLIDSYSFTIRSSSENLAKTVDVANVTHFERSQTHDSELKELEEDLKEAGRKPSPVRRDSPVSATPSEYGEEVFRQISKMRQEIEEQKKEYDHILYESRVISLLEANAIEMKDLGKMTNFDYDIGTLSDVGRKAIRSNYERIPAAVIHLGQLDREEVYCLIFPKKVAAEIQRLQESINWKKIEMTIETERGNVELMQEMERVHRELQDSIQNEEESLDAYIHKNSEDLDRLHYAYALQDMLADAKSFLAKGRSYFYLSGWMAASNEKKIHEALSGFSDLLIQWREEEEVPLKAPTLLKNKRWLRPFEAMVNLYGTPNYRELDPTNFFGLTYMILFGAMFGDLGQGAIFATAGIVLERLRHPNLGGVFLRMGLGSMFFGLCYGSVFGSEELLPALVIRPFENINTVLIAAISFGVVLSVISYVMGIVNKLRLNEYREAWFGKEGICGLLLYLSMILLIVNIAVRPILPMALVVLLLLGSFLGILFQEPLTNLVRKRRPLYQGAMGGYFVETGFSLLEAVISIFSGVLSFIRVGAFAINHVGLFMAFQTMGAMMGGGGNIAMLVLGNLVIIGLEGLIVFIQSLRLEYYEMFGKYFFGNGEAFVDTMPSLLARKR